MKNIKIPSVTLLTFLTFLTSAAAQSTAFTYQGRLNDGTNPANGVYDLRFRLAADPLGNNCVGSPVLLDGQPISNGRFTALLDFGANFPGAERWLEVGVRTNGIGNYSILAPFPRLTSTPYAITAGNVTGMVPSRSLGGSYSNGVNFNNSANQFSGAFSGSGSGLTDLNASSLSRGTIPIERLSPSVALLSAANLFQPSNDASGITVRQTTMTSPTADIFSVQSVDGGTTFLRVNTNGVVSWFGTANGDISGKAATVPWSGLTGVPPGFADELDNDTLYSAGAGLTLADTLFSVNFGGTGGATTVSRSDHTHSAMDIVTGTLPDGLLSGTYSGLLTLSNAANTFAGRFNGSGAGLTDLNASSLSLGIVSDARLSANVPLLNAVQMFTEANIFGPATDITGARIRQTSAASPTNDIFSVQNADGSLDYLRVDNTGQVRWSGTADGSISGNAASASTAINATQLGGQAPSFYLNPVNLICEGGNTISELCLPATVPLLRADQTFTGSNVFEGVLSVTNPANQMAGTFTGDGAGLTNLSGSNLISGTVAEARIDSLLARDSEVLPIVLAHDGSGSGLDADLLDGLEASSFAVAGHTHDDRYLSIGAKAADADLLDGLDSLAFASAEHDHDSAYWKIGGNSGTIVATDFLGTTDMQPLEVKVNNLRALRLEPTAEAPNVILGSAENAVQTNELDRAAVGAAIGGGYSNRIVGPLVNGIIAGGAFNSLALPEADRYPAQGVTISGGLGNSVSAHEDANARIWYATIGGGANNAISGDQAGGTATTIAGGLGNDIHGADAAVIGGGRNNVISHAGMATIGGGSGNRIVYDVLGDYDDTYSTISGGRNNAMTTALKFGSIGGGDFNRVAADYGTIAGGENNYVNALHGTVSGGGNNTSSGVGATVGGGFANSAQGDYGTVPGGLANLAGGTYSFAAGRRAKTGHTGAFVWADSSQDADVASTADNQFTARAAGGVRFFSDSGATTGVELAPGSGTWASLSDRNAKDNFVPANAQRILDKVAALPVTTWNYKSQAESIRHIGPTAQDFHAAFGVGENERTITTVDAAGVALAAIQGLNQKLEEQFKSKDAQIQKLQTENQALSKRVDTLEKLLGTLLTESKPRPQQ